MDTFVVYLFLTFYDLRHRPNNRVLRGNRVEMDLYFEANYALSLNDYGKLTLSFNALNLPVLCIMYTIENSMSDLCCACKCALLFIFYSFIAVGLRCRLLQVKQ